MSEVKDVGGFSDGTRVGFECGLGVGFGCHRVYISRPGKEGHWEMAYPKGVCTSKEAYAVVQNKMGK